MDFSRHTEVLNSPEQTTMESGRTAGYQRNEKLEHILKELNTLLHRAEAETVQQFHRPQYPVLLVVGGPRTGSTVMMQWIARLGVFAYPTNLLSRFYGAPYIGAKIQLMLTHPDYNYKDEILDFSGDFAYESDLGKTRGALAPNDFWYFWRRFIPNREPRYLEPEELHQIDMTNFLKELAALEHVFQQPWAMKGMILEQNLSFLHQACPCFLFLEITRHPFYNIQSLLESREKFFGTRNRWYSIKPREYAWLKDLPDPIMQVAGQVYYKNEALRREMEQVDAVHRLQIRYEDFCAHPEQVYHALREKMAQLGFTMPAEYRGPQQFPSANKVRLIPVEVEQIIEAYYHFSGERIEP